MKECVNVFLKPLLASEILTEPEVCFLPLFFSLFPSFIFFHLQVESIFWNFYEVYQNNKILLRKIQAAMKVFVTLISLSCPMIYSHKFLRWPEQNNLTTIFLNLNKMMEVYEEYIVHYQISITSLKELIKGNKVSFLLYPFCDTVLTPPF